MFFVLLSITATLISPIAHSLRAPESDFSNDPDFKLIRPYIHENTTTRIFANVGDSVQFECYASGTPGANITIEWSRPRYINIFEVNKNNLTLPNGQEVYSGNILKFPSVQPEHAGSYDCNAYEEHTLPSSQSYLLSIKSMPTIRSAVITKLFKEKNMLNMIKLSVQSSAVPEGEVIWYKNDQVLNHSNKYEMNTFNFDGTSNLIISTEDNDYHGTYKYLTRNELGYTEYSFVV